MKLSEILPQVDALLSNMPAKSKQQYVGYLSESNFNAMCNIKGIKRKKFFRHEGYKFYKVKKWTL